MSRTRRETRLTAPPSQGQEGSAGSSSGDHGPLVLAALALGVAPLLAFNVPPSATFLNQAAAVIGWGCWLVWLALLMPPGRRERVGAGGLALLVALGLLALRAVLSSAGEALPLPLAIAPIGALSAAAFVAAAAATMSREPLDAVVFRAFCVALSVAGILSAAIGALQVFAPAWTGSEWIAATAVEGRAVGNLRQPNHLAMLLLWAIVASVWLGRPDNRPRVLAMAAAMFMLFGLVLTASRTGMIGVAMLTVWGILDRRLPRPSRVLLWLVPLLYVVFWIAAGSLGGTGADAAFHGDTQLHRSDISSSRFGIWSNTLSLIAAHPWVGVGFGEFNFAWTLTPFPNRPTAFFDHTHNLPLQLAVELGLPLATLILALLTYALWCAFKAARDADERSAYLRPAFVMVLMIAVHSQLEYPLWYAYFLLPTAFLWGLCLGAPAKDDAAAVAGASGAPATAPPTPRRTRPLLIGAMLLMIGGIYSVIDYWKVVVIFAPSENAAPLSQRILEGRKSLFFGHHADYAAATSVPEPGNVMPAFKTATHFLLDTRLMMAWAQAYAAHGDLDRARHLAARLREFRNPASDEFFAPCDAPDDPAAPKPFQCQPPTKVMDYRDFR